MMNKNYKNILVLFSLLFFGGHTYPAFCDEKINAGVVYEFFLDVQNQIIDTTQGQNKLPPITKSELEGAYYKNYRPLNMLSLKEAYKANKKRHLHSAKDEPDEYNISFNGAIKPVQKPEEMLSQALVLKGKEKYKDALDVVDNIIKTSPKYTDAYFLKGDILRLEGRLEESVTEYLRAISTNPTYTNAYYNIAKIYEDSGNKQIALEYYRYAYTTNPSDYEIRNIILKLEKDNLNQS